MQALGVRAADVLGQSCCCCFCCTPQGGFIAGIGVQTRTKHTKALIDHNHGTLALLHCLHGWLASPEDDEQTPRLSCVVTQLLHART